MAVKKSLILFLASALLATTSLWGCGPIPKKDPDQIRTPLGSTFPTGTNPSGQPTVDVTKLPIFGTYRVDMTYPKNGTSATEKTTFVLDYVNRSGYIYARLNLYAPFSNRSLELTALDRGTQQANGNVSYLFQTESMQDSNIRSRWFVLELKLVFSGSTLVVPGAGSQVDSSRSSITIKDCGLSKGIDCRSTASDTYFINSTLTK